MDYKEILIEDIERFMKPFDWVGLHIMDGEARIVDIFHDKDGKLKCTISWDEEVEQSETLRWFRPDTLKEIYEELRYKFNGTLRQRCEVTWDETDTRYGMDLPKYVTVDLRMTGDLDDQLERATLAVSYLYSCGVESITMTEVV